MNAASSIALAAGRPASAMRLFDEADVPWIEQLLDLAERSVGEPWRVLVERIEVAPLRASPPQIAAIVGALRRAIGGRAERVRIARRVRGLVLGAPALDADARDARLEAAGAELGLDPVDVEGLMWADLSLERPVLLPAGRPAAQALAALANLARIQRTISRAHAVELRVWDEPHELVRAAARRGLIAAIARGSDGATVLELTGPLALFHRTTLYGRALAGLVPLLAGHEQFALEIRSRFDDRERTVRISPPLWLPPVPLPRSRRPRLAEQLARALAASGCIVEREPPPIEADGYLLFPELAVSRRGVRTLIELIGFSTEAYLLHKLAGYRAAGAPHVALCVDTSRGDPPPLPQLVLHTGAIDVEAVLSRLEVPL